MDNEINFRQELKYLIDIRDYVRVKSMLSAILKPDENSDNENMYHIRSLYFDDFKNTDLFSKISGLNERKKYRIRIYNNSRDLIRFEKKVKENLGSYKRSADISYEQAQAVINRDFSVFEHTQDPVLREIFNYNSMNILRPAVITDYVREAFINDEGSVRITFDSKLKTALTNTDLFDPDLIMIPAISSAQIILEVKYSGFLPDFIRTILLGTNAISLAISKFALCKKYINYNDWEVLA